MDNWLFHRANEILKKKKVSPPLPGVDVSKGGEAIRVWESQMGSPIVRPYGDEHGCYMPPGFQQAPSETPLPQRMLETLPCGGGLWVPATCPVWRQRKPTYVAEKSHLDMTGWNP